MGSARTIFLCGDVMLGRGIDQILVRPSDPRLEEPGVRDSREYVELAERLNGPIPRRAPPQYVWGDALEVLQREAPDARIVNLETSVTRAEERWPEKGIHYRMHPENVGALGAAGIDVCALANNHVLDHGTAGLEETLSVLRAAGIRTAGAGRTLAEARQPAIVDLQGGARILVFAFGTWSAGIEFDWAAASDRPGVDLLPDLSSATAEAIGDRVRALKRKGDVALASIHWGTNFGYDVPDEQVRFAHALVESGVDLVHGHSSHHPRPLEIHRGHLVLYGCGDLINDYEGISGYEQFRGDLVLMYFASVDPDSGELARLRMHSMRLSRFRLGRATPEEAAWTARALDRASRPFGVRVRAGARGVLAAEPTPVAPPGLSPGAPAG